MKEYSLQALLNLSVFLDFKKIIFLDFILTKRPSLLDLLFINDLEGSYRDKGLINSTHVFAGALLSSPSPSYPLPELNLTVYATSNSSGGIHFQWLVPLEGIQSKLRWAFSFHVYLFGCTFFILAVYTFTSVLNIR